MLKKILKTKWGGEVVLRNVGPEIANQLKAVLDGMPLAEVQAMPGPTEVFEDVEVEADLPYVAVGTYKGLDGWYVVEVKFDPTTGDSKIFSNLNAGNNKAFAIEKFKILASDHNLV